KIRSLKFGSDNKLYAGCADNSIRIWETRPDKIADELKAMISRSLTKAEWNEYIGDAAEYKKTL
ncbi:MAG: hypothetical protein IH946_09730, partial [Bacteroidetes bacterium]|nr:hypothetical protein [Bacteroidota bacterium]